MLRKRAEKATGLSLVLDQLASHRGHLQSVSNGLSSTVKGTLTESCAWFFWPSTTVEPRNVMWPQSRTILEADDKQLAVEASSYIQQWKIGDNVENPVTVTH